MARCPYLEYDNRGPWASQGDYYCDICKKNLDEAEVKYKCDSDDDDEYEKCPIYQDR